MWRLRKHNNSLFGSFIAMNVKLNLFKFHNYEKTTARRQWYYKLLAEGPGVAARGIFFLIFELFFSLIHPRVTHECPQKISAQSIQPFGRLSVTYIRMSCFII